jgi:hypothetical protein
MDRTATVADAFAAALADYVALCTALEGVPAVDVTPSDRLLLALYRRDMAEASSAMDAAGLVDVAAGGGNAPRA